MNIIDVDDKWWQKDLYCVEWYIPKTKLSNYYVLERRVFYTLEERTQFLKARKRKFWEILPFVQKREWVY